VWNTEAIVEIVAAGLSRVATDRDREQAVAGLDHLAELALQPLVGRFLRDAGYGVWPEERYPADRSHRRKSRGRRCDLVLTPPGEPARLKSPEARGSAAQLALPELPAEPEEEPADGSSDPESLLQRHGDTYWLEIKTVAQFSSRGAARDYGSRLLGDVAADVGKIASDPGIRHAGLLLILFTRDRETARHDLLAWQVRCLERDFPVFSPAVEGFPLNDRLGNGHATVALFPVVPLADAQQPLPGSELDGPAAT
jgi:hypothetical protein